MITGCAKLSGLSSLKNPIEEMIFESMKGKFEKVFYLAFKTEIKKSELKLFR